MPRSMTRWIDRTFRSSVNPPACPQRTCTLTPSPSSESLLDATAAATANSDFFQRLPYEVRRFILIDAFGGRILHMELKYDHPDMPLEKRAQDPELSSFHAYIGMPKQQEKRVEGWKPKQWQWQSTVCHRFSPRYVLRVPTVAQPHDDSCYSGEHIWCSAWPGEDMRKCLIGVMGWLLTCRQAYLEGIDVLYSTNIFNMANPAMIRNIPRILPSQRIVKIRSVEMRWDLHLFQKDKRGHPPYADLPEFQKLLDVVPTLFPNLKSLHISLIGDTVPRVDQQNYFDAVEAVILIPFDKMVRNLGQSVETCDLALPWMAYAAMKHAATGRSGLSRKPILRGKWERLWRELPKVELENEGSTSRLSGYWIYRGKRDFSLEHFGFLDESGDSDESSTSVQNV